MSMEISNDIWILKISGTLFCFLKSIVIFGLADLSRIVFWANLCSLYKPQLEESPIQIVHDKEILLARCWEFLQTRFFAKTLSAVNSLLKNIWSGQV